MDPKILVTYASQYGATKEIAERIGDVLRHTGITTDVLAVENVSAITGYRAIILGSGVYIGQWKKSAVQFLSAHHDELTRLPVWIFSSGPTGEGDPTQLADGWQLPKSVLPLVKAINPRGITLFHGNIDPVRLNFIQRWVIKSVIKKPFGDYRDWKSIDAWAAEIAVQMPTAG